LSTVETLGCRFEGALRLPQRVLLESTRFRVVIKVRTSRPIAGVVKKGRPELVLCSKPRGANSARDDHEGHEA